MEPRWTVQDSAELYGISHWGASLFSVNDAGHVVYRPAGSGEGIDLKTLIDDLRRRGIQTPLLLRFSDILSVRVAQINEAFAKSIKEYGYEGRYNSVMPIKVNQQRHVVEELVRYGAAYGLGLEAGSKPELLVAIALLQHDDLLVCNGYKDAEYVETALDAQRMGLRPYLVLDRFDELEIIIDAGRRLGLKPRIGIRAKLSTKGAGRWKSSTGDRSKFGLSAREMVKAVERLRDANLLDCLELLHFHIGSQITAIRSIRDAVREGTRLYCNLRSMGAVNLNTVDVGGGLAVDYDGSKTNFHSSRNYSMQEYANDVVWTIQEICDGNTQPHPSIFTEAGRALVAHHSVLVFNVLGVHRFADGSPDDTREPAADEHDVVHSMWDAYGQVNKKNYQEAYNDIVEAREESVTLFNHGIIDLRTRARVEGLFWATCERIQKATHETDYVPEDLSGLRRELSDTYYCNFSVFQSLPDAWAVGHLFPVLPIHRLTEEPQRDAIIADLTCDSDGKLDKFIDLRDVRDTLRLHAINGAPYYLGVFLVGAYQEILGDLHNLFGDTNAVHVTVDQFGGYSLDHLVEGDTVAEVLGYVEYDRAELVRRVRSSAETAVRAGRFTPEQFKDFMQRYEAGLAGYTYLEDID